MWRKVMDYAIKNSPLEYFDTPSVSDNTPEYMNGNLCFNNQVQTVLVYLNGYNDPQYNLWQTPIQRWTSINNPCLLLNTSSIPTSTEIININGSGIYKPNSDSE